MILCYDMAVLSSQVFQTTGPMVDLEQCTGGDPSHSLELLRC